MNTFKQGKGLVSLEEAKALIYQWFTPMEDFVEHIPSSRSLGRMLAEDIYANEDMPRFRKATMDGYALCLAESDLAAVLQKALTVSFDQPYQILGESRMGQADDWQLTADTAVYVPTGGKLPENANAVVKVEGTRLSGEKIHIENPKDIGLHWIHKGEDIQVGKLALSAGTAITPMSLGFLSLLGHEQVLVKKKLKIAIITTGDELVPSFDFAPQGKIRDINQVVLKGLAEAAGCEVVLGSLIPDQPEAVEQALLEAVAAADLVITSGASSMGKADIMPELIAKHSEFGLIFHGLNIKPGKPVGLARISGKAVLALPGNPVSSAMTFVVVAETLIGRLTARDLERASVNGILEKSCASQEGKTTFVPVKLIEQGGRYSVKPIEGKSGLISIVAGADGFMTLSPGETAEAGSTVAITLF